MNYNDIPQLTQCADRGGNVSWGYLEDHLRIYTQCPNGFEIDPEFQRGHAWTQDQQRRYVEFILKGGMSARDIYVNDPHKGDMPIQLVDGKQRITAVRKFMNNELRIFPELDTHCGDERGFLCCEIQGNMRMLTPDFVFHENDLQTPEEVLQWYIDLNAGGTPHTDEEIEKVRRMLKELKFQKAKEMGQSCMICKAPCPGRVAEDWKMNPICEHFMPYTKETKE